MCRDKIGVFWIEDVEIVGILWVWILFLVDVFCSDDVCFFEFEEVLISFENFVWILDFVGWLSKGVVLIRIVLFILVLLIFVCCLEEYLL